MALKMQNSTHSGYLLLSNLNRNNYLKILDVLVFSLILVSVLSNVYEVIALFKGELTSSSQSNPLTPFYIKSLKDILIFSLLIVRFQGIGKSFDELSLPVPFWICLLFFLISLFFTILYQNILSAAVAIRWFMPFLFFPAFFNFESKHIQKVIYKAITTVLIIGLVLQVLQFFYSSSYFGKNLLGFSLRNPGIYLIPSSMASLTMMAMYYTYNFASNSSVKSILLYFVCPLSILLTSSGSGILSILLFYGFLLSRFLLIDNMLSLILGVVVFTLAFLFLPELTGREDIYTSLTDRVGILLKNFEIENFIFSFNSAKATNTANLVNRLLGGNVQQLDAFVADSTIVSLISGIGLVGAVSFLILYLGYMRISQLRWTLFLSATFPFFLSTVAFEVFPFGILMMLNLSFLIKETLNSRNLL